jgi:collagenase-like PrtC family protease
MRLTLGPLQYFWPREQVLAFYRAAAEWPLDVIYLGETVCSKRRELRTRDWIALADELAQSGREIVLSTLALLEAESELSSLMRLVENGRFRIEANDMSAVQLLRERALPFIGGPALNVYNPATLRLLREDGLQRLVLGVEIGRSLVQEFRAGADPLPELEIAGWGRLPLAYSARCFTARAFDVSKDDCAFRCIEHAEGLPLGSRDGQKFLTINGIQVQTAGICDLGPDMTDLRETGIDLLRLYPQRAGMREVVERFRSAIDRGVTLERLGDENGYWRDTAGMHWVTAMG